MEIFWVGWKFEWCGFWTEIRPWSNSCIGLQVSSPNNIWNSSWSWEKFFDETQFVKTGWVSWLTYFNPENSFCRFWMKKLLNPDQCTRKIIIVSDCRCWAATFDRFYARNFVIFWDSSLLDYVEANWRATQVFNKILFTSKCQFWPSS